MIQRYGLSLASILATGTLLLAGLPAAALTTKECSVKYQAAKSAGTLGGETWNEFRKKECAGTEPAASPPPKEAKSGAATSPSPSSNAVFPKSVDSKYSKETSGKARFHTCLDQYHANKASNSNGGLKWIQKGGGYYSECNKALKG
jgi:hypothetical protein